MFFNAGGNFMSYGNVSGSSPTPVNHSSNAPVSHVQQMIATLSQIPIEGSYPITGSQNSVTGSLPIQQRQVENYMQEIGNGRFNKPRVIPPPKRTLSETKATKRKGPTEEARLSQRLIPLPATPSNSRRASAPPPPTKPLPPTPMQNPAISRRLSDRNISYAEKPLPLPQVKGNSVTSTNLSSRTTAAQQSILSPPRPTAQSKLGYRIKQAQGLLNSRISSERIDAFQNDPLLSEGALMNMGASEYSRVLANMHQQNQNINKDVPIILKGLKANLADLKQTAQGNEQNTSLKELEAKINEIENQMKSDPKPLPTSKKTPAEIKNEADQLAFYCSEFMKRSIMVQDWQQKFDTEVNIVMKQINKTRDEIENELKRGESKKLPVFKNLIILNGALKANQDAVSINKEKMNELFKANNKSNLISPDKKMNAYYKLWLNITDTLLNGSEESIIKTSNDWLDGNKTRDQIDSGLKAALVTSFGDNIPFRVTRDLSPWDRNIEILRNRDPNNESKFRDLKNTVIKFGNALNNAQPVLNQFYHKPVDKVDAQLKPDNDIIFSKNNEKAQAAIKQLSSELLAARESLNKIKKFSSKSRSKNQPSFGKIGLSTKNLLMEDIDKSSRRLIELGTKLGVVDSNFEKLKKQTPKLKS